MRALVCLVAFLTFGSLTHLVGLFILPLSLPVDAFTRLSSLAPLNSIRVIDPTVLRQSPFVDPATELAICRYDLSAGPFRIRVPLSETFLSVGLAVERRGLYASVSDRAATGGVLDVVVATEAQLKRISALDDAGEAVEEMRIPAPSLRGMVILKVLVDRPSSRAQARRILAEAQCESESLTTSAIPAG